MSETRLSERRCLEITALVLGFYGLDEEDVNIPERLCSELAEVCSAIHVPMSEMRSFIEQAREPI